MTYLYETIPAKKGEKEKQFEIKQSANDAPLTKHPETGEPIRRVILGGWGLLSSKAPSGGSSKSGCGCGPGQTCG
jgi:predicted nucleic acid-binding Zn ribbon protein